MSLESQNNEINKGIEFMLRRRTLESKPEKGLSINKTFNLLQRTFHFNMEFLWGVEKPNKEK